MLLAPPVRREREGDQQRPYNGVPSPHKSKRPIAPSRPLPSPGRKAGPAPSAAAPRASLPCRRLRSSRRSGAPLRAAPAGCGTSSCAPRRRSARRRRRRESGESPDEIAAAAGLGGSCRHAVACAICALTPWHWLPVRIAVLPQDAASVPGTQARSDAPQSLWSHEAWEMRQVLEVPSLSHFPAQTADLPASFSLSSPPPFRARTSRRPPACAKDGPRG